MATTNIQSFAGDIEVTGELTVTGQLNSTTGSDKVKLTATTSDETDYIAMAKGTTGAQALYTDSNLTYNPANNVIGANLSGNVTGNVSGNAAFATNATYATSAGSATNATFANAATNATYANSAGSATNATFATSATHANQANTVAFTDRDSSNNSDYIAFVDTHGAGDKALFTDQNLSYNSSTNHINANVPYANNAGTLQGRGYSEAANASSIVSRDGSGHLNMVYGFSSYLNMSHGANTRNGDAVFYSSYDNYIRKNTASGMRNSLGVQQLTAGSVVQMTAYDQHTRSMWNFNGNLHISNVNGNIAPKYNNSKILCQWYLSRESSYDMVYRVYRNNSLVGYNSQGGTNIWSGVAAERRYYFGNADMARINISYIDYPGTTSNVTYKLYLKDAYTGNASRYISINRCRNSAGQSIYENGISTIVMTEIKV